MYEGGVLLLNRAKKIMILLLFLLVVGCNDKQENFDKPLTFNGEGEFWSINNYQVGITPKSFFAGNGELSMKKTNPYYSDSFSCAFHAEINGEDQVIHRSSISGEANIAFKEIGKISGGPYITKNGEPITYDQFKNLYVIIEWEDSQGNKKEEKIQMKKLIFK